MTVPTFPDSTVTQGIAWPVVRSPSWLSVRQEAVSGKRTDLPQRSVPRWTWELSYDVLRSAAFAGAYTELETLIGFYNVAKSTGGCFGYRDDEDNAATAQGFGVGDGVTTTFQLVRAYGGFVEPVYLPTVTGLTVGGVAKATPADYSVGATGIVTFVVAPVAAAALAWTGTFKWLCRFDEDSLNLSRFMVGFTEAKSLKFSSEINP